MPDQDRYRNNEKNELRNKTAKQICDIIRIALVVKGYVLTETDTDENLNEFYVERLLEGNDLDIYVQVS